MTSPGLLVALLGLDPLLFGLDSINRSEGQQTQFVDSGKSNSHSYIALFKSFPGDSDINLAEGFDILYAMFGP